MSQRTAKRAEKEAARAAILRLLLQRYPEPMTFAALQQALLIERIPLHERDLTFQLGYLEQRHYLTLERAALRLSPNRILLASLTDKGVDLLDGRIPPDPGIAI